MARPAKIIATKTGIITKAEEKSRIETETQLRGNADKLTPPDYLTSPQAEIFEYVLTELEEAKILGNLDVFSLAQLSVSTDRLRSIESAVNQDSSLLRDSKLMASRDRYSKDFLRLCNEFCLSPQSRAKLSISALKPEEKKKTLMDLINEDDEEE